MSSDGVNTGRRQFLTAATSAVGVAGVVGIAVPFLGSWNPSAKAKAAGAPVKADIGKVEPGQMIVVEWRG
jgi:ubiquinol-cytochrome c reductase iron-sulfur subunit